MTDEIGAALEELREPTPRELELARRRLRQQRGIARLTQLFSGRQWTPDDLAAEAEFREAEKAHRNRAMRRKDGERGYSSHPLTKRWDLPSRKPRLRTRRAK